MQQTLRKQRPTAKELLQHRFVKYARRTSQLSELIDRHREWKTNGPKKDMAAKDKKGKDALDDESSGTGTVMSNWAFDTVRAEQEDEVVIGTVRQVCYYVYSQLTLVMSRANVGELSYSLYQKIQNLQLFPPLYPPQLRQTLQSAQNLRSNLSLQLQQIQLEQPSTTFLINLDLHLPHHQTNGIHTELVMMSMERCSKLETSVQGKAISLNFW